jgi:trans-2,3-dihydro-3-hydroxyanthranilate isomerase
MQVPFRLLDVFAEAPFAGNQLCVVSETPDGLDGETMQTLSHEIGFSETTFVTAIRDGGYDVRIFTPDDEIAFAGHPTLGTAFALVEAGLVTSPVVQTSTAGDVTVEVDLDANQATMRQLPPVFGPEVTDRDAVANAAGLQASDLVDGLPVVSASTGLAHLMVPVKDEATLRRAERDDRGCGEVCAATDAESLYLFAVRGDGDVMARMFDRGITIGEDPATGSGAGPLGAYLSEHALAGMPGKVTVAQGEMVRRPSFLHVEVEAAADSWAISVAGGVRIVGEGRFAV